MRTFDIIRRHPLWLVWHPHQGLWNRLLVNTIVALPVPSKVHAFLDRLAMRTDTGLLWLRALWRRTRRVNPLALRKKLKGETFWLLDCGLHESAHQSRAVHDWFGADNTVRILAFEACEAHALLAANALADIPNCTLHRVALIGPEHQAEPVKLYHSEATSLGNSLYSQRGTEFELAPAKRLSAFIAEHIDIENVPVVVRANIEGAEQGMIEDLVDAGLHKQIDAYMGMWDDLFKIDVALDHVFQFDG